MIVYRLRFVVVLTLLVLIVSHTAFSEQQGYYYRAGRHLTIVAVTSVRGSYIGVTADLYVAVACPGEGHVYVETKPLTEIDTQASARIAALVAARIAGIPFNSCDYFIRINASSPIVGGPSASAAMAVGLAAALLDLPLNSSIIITGMIMPDGTIGPVGGLVEKLEAAARHGAKIFLIPQGESLYPRMVGLVPVLVNLTALGRKLGVKVIEVENVQQALSIFTNGAYRYTKPNSSRVIERSLQMLDKVRDLLVNWIDSEKDELLKLGTLINKSIIVVKNTVLWNDIAPLLQEFDRHAEELQHLASSFIKKNKLYVAASLLFQSLVYRYAELYLLKIVTGTKVESILSDLENKFNDIIEKITHAVKARNSIYGVGIAIEALSRAIESYVMCIEVNSSLTTLSLDELALKLGYAKARLFSSDLWFKAINYLSNNISVNYRIIEELAQLYYSLAEASRYYVLALAEQFNYAISTKEADYYLTIARSSSNALVRMAASIKAYSYLLTTLYSLVSISTRTAVKIINDSIALILSRLLSMNLAPPDIALYLSYASIAQHMFSSNPIPILVEISTIASLYEDMITALTKYSSTPHTALTIHRASNTAKVEVLTTTRTVTTTKTVVIYRERAASLGYVMVIAIIASILLASALLLMYRGWKCTA